MKEISNITTKGITYIDEDGDSQFINFETCSQNHVMRIEQLQGSSFTDVDKAFWEKGRFVGTRVTFRQPPAIEFYTQPRIYFEFSTCDDVWKVASRIKEVGWRINDSE